MRRAKNRRGAGKISSAVSAAPAKGFAKKGACKEIGNSDRRAGVDGAARGEVAQQGGVPGIGRIAHDPCQVPGVAQAEVQALPGNRVQGLRGVADVNGSFGDAFLPHPQNERVRRARRHGDRTAGTRARRCREFLEEVGFRC